MGSLMAATPHISIASMDPAPSSEAPRPENYANYSLYIQALFTYQKMQNKEAGAASKPCKIASEEGTIEIAKSDACQTKTLTNTGEAGTASQESLEEAASKRQTESYQTYISTSRSPRSTFSSFPLNPITSQDLSLTGVGGLLGLFNSLVTEKQTTDSANNQLSLNNRPVTITDSDSRNSNDFYSLLYTQAGVETLLMNNKIVLQDGSGYVEVTTKIAGSGLELHLNSNVRTGLHIVDRDGYPGSYFDGAGAVVVDSLGISIPSLYVNIQGTNRASNNPDLILAQIRSPEAITIDLSGTRIGVADALRDGSKIGTPTSFMSFGPQSVMTIAPGMSMNTVLSRPNGLVTPLTTLNGSIGTISLQDVSLLENGTSALNIGVLGIDGIQLVNTKIFIVDKKIIIDAGTGINNGSMWMERVSFGDIPTSTMLGDFYISHINLVNARMTVEAH